MHKRPFIIYLKDCKHCKSIANAFRSGYGENIDFIAIDFKTSKKLNKLVGKELVYPINSIFGFFYLKDLLKKIKKDKNEKRKRIATKKNK